MDCGWEFGNNDCDGGVDNQAYKYIMEAYRPRKTMAATSELMGSIMMERSRRASKYMASTMLPAIKRL